MSYVTDGAVLRWNGKDQFKGWMLCSLQTERIHNAWSYSVL